MKRSFRRPVLVVIAGPNGAGKTEFAHSALGHEWLAECEYVNPDEIARDVFGSWDDEKAVLAALRHAESVRHKCLAERRSLAFETVFSTEEKIQFISQAKQVGYFVRFFFIGTDTPQINAARIAKRVALGGHDVPTRKSVERFYRSAGNLVHALRLVDRGYVYDNSVDDESPTLQFRTEAGQIKKIYRQEHDWAEQARKTLARKT
ncbi:MAG: zeta toxin family protein [Gemmatimonadetes bacterium]|nr:zeta toxin family protein [Gemmatimonadota bacterium]